MLALEENFGCSRLGQRAEDNYLKQSWNLFDSETASLAIKGGYRLKGKVRNIYRRV